MKTVALLISFACLLLSSCATAPAPAERMTLKDAIVGTSKALTDAEKEIRDNKYRTFGMRPSKATVAFDLSVTSSESVNGQLTVAPPTTPVGGILGWSVSKQTQTGNHITLEFTPTK